ncbi:MAG: putative tail fiber protein [Prokaryotic dsDNA virus sp.]|nr:MAG: putative tail fiber protein [Prokaryotic dsDNA virus sp.]|tara:strand:+ start:15178 stop:15693 length:516 start_codon:yes stop_codon:yes gene_type:complete
MKMIISGQLLTPIGEPLSGVRIRLTAVNTSAQVFKFTSDEFTTDEDGNYSVDVPVGRYTVEHYDVENRGFRNIGTLTVRADTQLDDLTSLLLVEATTTPRDPLLQMIEDKVANIDTTVRTALSEALDDIGVGATFISADENNRLKVGQDGGYYVSDDFIPDPLAHYILAKG